MIAIGTEGTVIEIGTETETGIVIGHLVPPRLVLEVAAAASASRDLVRALRRHQDGEEVGLLSPRAEGGSFFHISAGAINSTGC